MSVQIESLLPSTGQLQINIQLAATINVTAFSAKQKVTGFVADAISNNMQGADPTLIVGDKICWRVPIILSLPPVVIAARSARLMLMLPLVNYKSPPNL
jgi:hypothetical protein